MYGLLLLFIIITYLKKEDLPTFGKPRIPTFKLLPGLPSNGFSSWACFFGGILFQKNVLFQYKYIYNIYIILITVTKNLKKKIHLEIKNLNVLHINSSIYCKHDKKQMYIHIHILLYFYFI